MPSQFKNLTINGYRIPTGVYGAQLSLMCRAILMKPGITRTEALKVFCGRNIDPMFGGLSREEQRSRYISLSLDPNTTGWAAGPESEDRSPSGKIFIREKSQKKGKSLCLFPIQGITEVVASQYEARVAEIVEKLTLGPAQTPVGSLVKVWVINGDVQGVSNLQGLVIRQGWRCTKSYRHGSVKGTRTVESLWGLVDDKTTWFEIIVDS